MKCPTKLFVGNTAAIERSVANGPTTRSKHIDTRARFIQEKVQENLVRPIHISTVHHIANIFTKPLHLPALRRNISLTSETGTAAAQGDSFALFSIFASVLPKFDKFARLFTSIDEMCLTDFELKL